MKTSIDCIELFFEKPILINDSKLDDLHSSLLKAIESMGLEKWHKEKDKSYRNNLSVRFSYKGFLV